MNQKETLVYNELASRLTNYSELTIWLSHNYDKEYWLPILDKEQERINAIKKWAKTLPWSMVRHYYLSWIRWYYQPGLWAAKIELYFQFTKRGMDRYYRAEKKRRDAITAFSGDIPRPK